MRTVITESAMAETVGSFLCQSGKRKWGEIKATVALWKLNRNYTGGSNLLCLDRKVASSNPGRNGGRI